MSTGSTALSAHERLRVVLFPLVMIPMFQFKHKILCIYNKMHTGSKSSVNSLADKVNLQNLQ